MRTALFGLDRPEKKKKVDIKTLERGVQLLFSKR